MTHDELSIHEYVSTEYQCSDRAVDHLISLATWEECGYESEEDEYPQRPKKVWLPCSEIVFALACEQGQSDKYTGRQDKRQENDSGLVESNDDADRVCFESCKAAKEEQVCRIRLAFPECQEHESDGSEEGKVHHPDVRLDPMLVSFTEV